MLQDSSATPPVFSSSEKEEPEKKGGGVKFTLGEQADDDEDEEEVSVHFPFFLTIADFLFYFLFFGFHIYMIPIYRLICADISVLCFANL